MVSADEMKAIIDCFHDENKCVQFREIGKTDFWKELKKPVFDFDKYEYRSRLKINYKEIGSKTLARLCNDFNSIDHNSGRGVVSYTADDLRDIITDITLLKSMLVNIGPLKDSYKDKLDVYRAAFGDDINVMANIPSAI